MVKNMVEALIKMGNDVNGTYEFVGEIVVNRVLDTNSMIERYNLDKDVIDKFVWAITHFEEVMVGPYDTSKYLHLLPSIKKCLKHLKSDCYDTRRCVITFPSEHCFQSIQFLYRDNTINVICFMRSCDAIKNLAYDMWLCSFLGDVFKKHFEDVTGLKPHPVNRIVMTIGSLHVYKEDL